MLGVESECFEHGLEKCCRAGKLECLMIYLNFILLDHCEAVLFTTTVIWCSVTPNPGSTDGFTSDSVTAPALL